MGCEFNLLPAQKEFFEIPHDNNLDIALYQGGFGSGKTFAGSLLGITLALRFAGIRGLVGAQTYALVRDTTLKQYIEHLEKMGIRYEYKISTGTLSFENGSEILFRHLEEANKIKSLNLGFAEIEEMSDVPEATFKMILGRMRQEVKPEWKGFRYRIFGHTNPEKARGWIYDYFVRNKKDNYRRIIAPTTENKNLSPDFLQALRDAYNDDYYAVNVLGQDVDTTLGLVTKNFNFSRQILEKHEIDPKLPIHVTCDFNHDPMCWYIFQQYDGNVYIIKEIVEQYATTEHCAHILAEGLTNFKECDIILNGDSTGDSKTTKGADYIIIKNVLVQRGFDKEKINVRILPKNPNIEYRINCWNNMICDSNKEPHIFIVKDCQWLIYNIENLEVEEGGSRPKKISTGKLRSDSKAKYLSHPIDAVTYPICLYYPIRDLHLGGASTEDMMDVYGDKYNN